MARPLLDEIEAGDYDLSGLVTFTNGGAALSPTVRERLLAALPNVMVLDAVGSSESGVQMTTIAVKGVEAPAATFTPQHDTAVVSADFSRVLGPGDGEGWLARRGYVPLGYPAMSRRPHARFPLSTGALGDPGDRANYLADGRIELLGRDSVTINSGGEKIFAEEVERPYPATRPSTTWWWPGGPGAGG